MKIDIDPVNPSTVIGACGLFELVSRSLPGVSGHFEDDSFVLSCSWNEVAPVLEALSQTSVRPEPISDKPTIKTAVVLEDFDMLLDWYRKRSFEHFPTVRLGRHTDGPRSTWSGKQSILDILDVQKAFTGELLSTMDADSACHMFFLPVYDEGKNVGIDFRSTWRKEDVGWSPHSQDTHVAKYPFADFLMLIGMQTFRPQETEHGLIYARWNVSVPVELARIFVTDAYPRFVTDRWIFRFEPRIVGRDYYWATPASPA